MSYQTVDYEGAAHIIIVDDYGCFTGTQPADDLPTEFVNLQDIVPFRSQDTRAIPQGMASFHTRNPRQYGEPAGYYDGTLWHHRRLIDLFSQCKRYDGG